MRYSLARVIVAIAVLLTGAPAAPNEPRHVSMVPWKVLQPGDEPPRHPLVLYWIPATRDEVRRSELLVSDELTMYARHCVGMQVVRPDDDVMIEKLEAGDVLPVAILADASGEEVARVDADRGALRLSEVEEMVRDELDERASEAESLLDDARRLAHAGEVAAAIALYQKVWEQRCMCPRQGRDAQRALRKLEKK